MPSLILVVAVAGAATMTVELAAVRLLAPWFGTSSLVWTNVIGVILLALAMGYLLGARLSRTGDPRSRLGAVLLVAGAMCAWLPFLAGPVAGFFLPPGLALDQAAGLFLWGSLATSCVLFLPAATALGCVGPLAVEALERIRMAGAGDAGGRVLAASTLGSLLGTFGTTHLFVPVIGLRGTFLGASALLGLCGAWLAWRHRGAAAPSALILLAFPLSTVLERPMAEGVTLLEARESSYQHLEVVGLPGPGGGRRWLQVNESCDSYQSVWSPEDGLLGPGFYYDYFVPPAHWEGAGGPWRVLVLGLGAGTAVRVLEGALPAGTSLVSTGVELDPEVVKLGVKWFDLQEDDGARRVFSGVDARTALRGLPGPFDQVILDCYADNMEIPSHLATVEFFSEVAAVVRDGGWICANVGGFGVDDPVVSAFARTLAFGVGDPVACARVPFSRNVMLYARRGGGLPSPGSPSFYLPGELSRLTSPLDIPGAWQLVPPSADQLLTDNHSAIDQLQRLSISAGRQRFLE